MGNSCCEQTNAKGKIFESEDIPRMNEYEQAEWPANDIFLAQKLQSSKIASSEAKEKPFKHKIYDRWYWGDWSNGQPKGKGIIYNKSHQKAMFYEGDFDGEPNGQGKFIFNGGEAEFEGHVVKGKANGKGVYRNHQEDYQFAGDWKDSAPEEGSLVVVKKNQHTGKKEKIFIELGKGNNPSEIRYPDGRFYVGEIDKKKLIPHGHGKVTYPNNNSYEGDWKEGEMHGKGRFVWDDGSYYEGDYSHNKKHGQGRIVFPSHNYYEGYWDDGYQHGKGVMFNKDGEEIQKGVWKKGQFFGNL